MRGGIHHIDLTVREPQASFALYDSFLRFLGYKLVSRGDAAIEWTLEDGKGSPSISLVKAKGGGNVKQHDRYSPGSTISPGQPTVVRTLTGCMRC
jgi:catechol 2,3-dioxygenase-like lactoylglutathione lyase family enzyme